MAVDIEVNYDKMVRFSTDFDPGSVEAVTLEGGEFRGPQRYVAQRGGEDSRILVSDWDGVAANARLVAFDGDDAKSWSVYLDGGDPFVFFELIGPLIV